MTRHAAASASDRTSLTLRPPANPVERRAIGWWSAQSLLIAGPVLIAAVVAWTVWPQARPWTTLAIAAAAVLLVIGTVVEPLWRFRVHRWETTASAVYVRTGWLVREWRATPLARVQTIDAVQGPLEQLMGLSTLRVTTASSGGAVEISGLDKAVADRVAAELTETAQLTPGDAT